MKFGEIWRHEIKICSWNNMAVWYGDMFYNMFFIIHFKINMWYHFKLQTTILVVVSVFNILPGNLTTAVAGGCDRTFVNYLPTPQPMIKFRLPIHSNRYVFWRMCWSTGTFPRNCGAYDVCPCKWFCFFWLYLRT